MFVIGGVLARDQRSCASAEYTQLGTRGTLDWMHITIVRITVGQMVGGTSLGQRFWFLDIRIHTVLLDSTPHPRS